MSVIASDRTLGSAEEPGSKDELASAPRVRSDVLLGGKREIVILHGGREYRLRVTQNEKLILTA